MKYMCLIFLSLLTFTSCDNSEKLKIHEQKLSVAKVKKQTHLTDNLKSMETLLEEAKNDLENVNAFQIGRDLSTKNQQIADVNKRILYIETYITNIKNELAEIELTQTYDFQDDPKRTLEQLFESSKRRDFSNFRHLCDPYFEDDSKGEIFCLLPIFEFEDKESFAQNFENARIVGAPIMEGDRARYEVASGPDANKLVQIVLVKRMGNWYFFDIDGDI